MKSLTESISANLNSGYGNKKPNNKAFLKQIIKERIIKEGPKCNLNDIDVSLITDFAGIFYNSDFNGDISKWDVSHATTMYCMFMNSKFNKDISNWDVSNVTDMESMFEGSKFNGNISKWNVSHVTNMHDMFYNSKFNQDISTWNVKNVIDTFCTFDDCPIKDSYKPHFNN